MAPRGAGPARWGSSGGGAGEGPSVQRGDGARRQGQGERQIYISQLYIAQGHTGASVIAMHGGGQQPPPCAGAAHAADRVAETVAAALGSMAERFRDRAGAVRGDAARLGSEAAKAGKVALRRLADEVEERPLIMLAVAVGVGILVGLAS